MYRGVSEADDRRKTPESAKEPKIYEAARIPHTLPTIVFLGIDDRPDASETSVPAEVDPENPRGVPYFALDATNLDADLHGGGYVEGRSAGTALSPWDAGVYAQARALIDWNVRNKVRSTYLLQRPLIAQVLCGLWLANVFPLGWMEAFLHFGFGTRGRQDSLLLYKGLAQLCLSAHRPRHYNGHHRPYR